MSLPRLIVNHSHPAIRAVFFDFYGVVGYDPIADFIRTHQLSPNQIDKIHHYCQKSDQGQYSHINEFYSDIGQLIGWTAAATEKFLDDHSGIFTPLIPVINELRHHRIKVAILSNADRSLHQQLHKIKLLDHVDRYFMSAELQGVTKPKPDPEFYRYAANQLDILPSEAAFFDDRPENIAGAKMAGLHAFLFTDIASCRSDLKKLELLR